MEFAISQPKKVRSPRNEKQTYRLNSRPQMWPSGLTLAMTLTLNLQGQIWNLLYISQNRPIATKQKANISIGLQASIVTIRFDLGHDFDLEFARSNMEFAISQPKVVRLPRNERQTFWLTSRSQMWRMGLTLSMILTFDFSRSNVTLVLTTRLALTKDFYSQILK